METNFYFNGISLWAGLSECIIQDHTGTHRCNDEVSIVIPQLSRLEDLIQNDSLTLNLKPDEAAAFAGQLLLYASQCRKYNEK